MSYQMRGTYPVSAAGPSCCGAGATKWVPPHTTSLCCSCLDSLMTCRGQRRCTVPRLGVHTDPGPPPRGSVTLGRSPALLGLSFL